MYNKAGAFRLRDEKKKEEEEEENRGRPSRAKDLQTGREKVEKNSANNRRRRRKIEGPTSDFKATRGLDTGVGMEACIVRAPSRFPSMKNNTTRTDYKSTDCI